METLAATRSRARPVYLGITALHGAIRGWPHMHYCAWGWEGRRKSRSSGPSQLHSELPGTLPDKTSQGLQAQSPQMTSKLKASALWGGLPRQGTGLAESVWGLVYISFVFSKSTQKLEVNLKANQ